MTSQAHRNAKYHSRFMEWKRRAECAEAEVERLAAQGLADERRWTAEVERLQATPAEHTARLLTALKEYGCDEVDVFGSLDALSAALADRDARITELEAEHDAALTALRQAADYCARPDGVCFDPALAAVERTQE